MERAISAAHDDWTLVRASLPDRPGGFAVLTRCLAACGVDILTTEIVGRRDGRAIADVLVHGGDLERALRALDEDVTLLDLEPLAGTTAGLGAIARLAADAVGPVFAEPPAGSTLAMPFGAGGVCVLALGRALPFPFMAAEVDRLAALGVFVGAPG
jgi:hypothetical protein